MARVRNTTTDQIYNRFQRDAVAAKFYNSAAWKRARAAKVLASPICERCRIAVVEIVHHRKPLADCTDNEKTAQFNLESTCRKCHGSAHGKTSAVTQIIGQLQVTEDAAFRFDENKASAVGRFAAKFCHHFRGSLRGQPFELHPIQQDIIRPVFGYVHRETGFRRFNSLWLESGIGSGKTPLLAIIGLFGLLGDGEAGAQIYSLANSFGQAEHMFGMAKTFIKNGPLMTLVSKGKLAVKQYEIVYKPTDSRWQITSGSGAKAGGAASMLLVDEVHQIEDRAAYDDLQGRQSKRDQPLTVCCTNAAKHPHPLYQDLHEEAADTLTNGPRTNRRLFPVVWAAPQDADPSSPASWRRANPLIGTTIEQSKVADEWGRAKGSPALENRFRLQYLGQRVSDADKWIDLSQWDAATGPLTAEQTRGPLYIGLDMSRNDDLCAMVSVYPTAATYAVTSRFWTPKATALKYQESHDVPYEKWGTLNAITLLDEPTISTAVQERIAAEVIDLHRRHPIEVVCYDRAYAESTIKLIEAAGITCQPVGQGWGVSSGCHELARRLKESSIVIEPNPVMRFCAENVEIKQDDRGNIWPVKPNAKGKYAGKKQLKIDGIASLVTALTVAKQHRFVTKPHVGAMLVDL